MSGTVEGTFTGTVNTPAGDGGYTMPRPFALVRRVNITPDAWVDASTCAAIGTGSDSSTVTADVEFENGEIYSFSMPVGGPLYYLRIKRVKKTSSQGASVVCLYYYDFPQS